MTKPLSSIVGRTTIMDETNNRTAAKITIDFGSQARTRYLLLLFAISLTISSLIWSINITGSLQTISNQNDFMGWIPFTIVENVTNIFHNGTMHVTENNNENVTASLVAEPRIQLTLPQEETQWIKNRSKYYDTWFDQTDKLKKPADSKGHPILDFIVVGFPKCGTTTLMANLAKLAPMPSNQDVCTPPSPTTYYAYRNWPKEYGNISIIALLPSSNDDNGTTVVETTFEKVFRSTKCPRFIDSSNWMKQYSKYLTQTKYIIGIRHPIKWFESFWRMLNKNGPYQSIKMCPCKTNNCRMNCRSGCLGRQIYCLARARFHLPLARLGKTALSAQERKILAPNDIDGGENIKSSNITNPIFLYDQTELRDSYLWEELADFIGVSKIPNGEYHGSKGKAANRTLCDPFYDAFRAMMMPYSFELSMWLQHYFLPVAEDTNRPDVRVANPNKLREIAKSYIEDPCKRLMRLQNGTYVLDPSFGLMIPPPQKIR